MRYASWVYCKKCKQLIPEKLLPRFLNYPPIKAKAKCACVKERYVIPKKKDIPKVLVGLSNAKIIALRPLNVHTGEYEKDARGYRKKGGMFRLSWSKDSIETKINRLNRISKRKCNKPFNFLMNSNDSCYKQFVLKREEQIQHSYCATLEVGLQTQLSQTSTCHISDTF